MSHFHRQAILVVTALLLIAGCTWWWFATMEKRWESRPQVSAAARENSMLGATRLLSRHQHTVSTASTLAETLMTPLPAGTLMLAQNSGVVTREQTEQLLAWVRQGNTLIIRPQWADRTLDLQCGEQDDSDAPQAKPNTGAIETDAISAYLEVELVTTRRSSRKESDEATEARSATKKARQPCLAQMTLPDTGHVLRLDIDYVTLQSTGNKLTPLFADDTGEAVRVYAEGTGHIAVVADTYFDNDHLAWNDNAELLLTLTGLNRNAQHVLIVQHLDMPPWYLALWWHFPLGIVSLGCGLLLLLWFGVRRFGPLLPGPDQERRSLMEHIDASGRWLWKVPGGRDILLTAARESINKLLQRRAPELLRMRPDEQADHLTHYCKLPTADIVNALFQPAARLPSEFTRQIQTLQQLRKHYER